MTIVPVSQLDRHDLTILGDNVRRAIRDDHEDAAIERTLACHELDEDGCVAGSSNLSILAWRS
jgi:hypothetical protein